MDRQTTRKVRYFLRLHYPVQITATEDGFCGRFPDLPGCVCEHSDLRSLYRSLEHGRRQWIADRLMAGGGVPMPNDHLKEEAPIQVMPPAYAEQALSAAL